LSAADCGWHTRKHYSGSTCVAQYITECGRTQDTNLISVLRTLYVYCYRASARHHLSVSVRTRRRQWSAHILSLHCTRFLFSVHVFCKDSSMLKYFSLHCIRISKESPVHNGTGLHSTGSPFSIPVVTLVRRLLVAANVVPSSSTLTLMKEALSSSETSGSYNSYTA
jgi:hypothetical protein